VHRYITQVSPTTHSPSSKESAQSPSFMTKEGCAAASPVACASASSLILSLVKLSESSSWGMSGRDLFLLGGFFGVRKEGRLVNRGMPPAPIRSCALLFMLVGVAMETAIHRPRGAGDCPRGILLRRVVHDIFRPAAVECVLEEVLEQLLQGSRPE